MANRLIQLTCLMSCVAYCIPSWGQYGPPGPQMQYSQPRSLQHPNYLLDPAHCELPLGNGTAAYHPMNPDVHPLPYLPGGPVTANQVIPGQRYSNGDGHITHVAAEIDQCDPWEEETEFERFINTVARNSWFRLDYLNWSTSDPGNQVIGHDRYINIYDQEVDSRKWATEYYTEGIPNQLTDQSFGFYQHEDVFDYDWYTVRGTDTNDFSFQNKSGIRGTFGIPLVNGEVQISSFLLDPGAEKDFIYDELFPVSFDMIERVLMEFGIIPEYSGESFVRKFFALPVTVDGAVVPVVNEEPDFVDFDFDLLPPIQYYDDVQVRMTSDVWGADIKYLIDPHMPKQKGLINRGVIGVSYLQIQETLNFYGANNVPGLQSRFNGNNVTTMDVDSFNNLYGGLFGFNSELRHEKFVLGVEPKIMAGFNNFRTRIKTSNVVFNGEETDLKVSRSEFAPMLDLQAYLKWHCSESFDLFLAYDLKYAGKVARPASQVNYNVISNDDDSFSTDFSYKHRLQEFKVEGLTVGGEWRFY